MQQLVQATSTFFGIAQEYIYKDYFVCTALKEIVAANTAFVFKGGTALSKCYGIIDRFSEDVDLGLDTLHPTQGMRKKAKSSVQGAMDKLTLSISNLDKTRSRREFNQYLIPLPQILPGLPEDFLIIETALMTSASPSQSSTVMSFVGEYLLSQNRQDIIEQFELERFDVNVVALERTFTDKAFCHCRLLSQRRNTLSSITPCV